MSQLFVLRALLFAGECFAASFLLLGTAAIAVRFLKAASLRHLVWLTAFGSMLVFPAAALIVPSQIALHRPVQVEQSAPATEPRTVSAAFVPMLPRAPAPSWNLTRKNIALTLFVLWLVGLAWNALRLLIGAIGINALHMSSRRMNEDQRRGLADMQGCDLRVADDHSGPMTWGTLRPVILLPNEASGWPHERLRAALLHEIAHVRRRDSFAQSLSRIACALYWPNPLAWIGARAMRREAEITADDTVIAAGIRPSAYAQELLEIAGEFPRRRFAGGLAMASESALEARIKSVLTSAQIRRGVTSMDFARIAGAGLLATAAFVLVRPSLAKDAAPARAAVLITTAIAAVPAVPAEVVAQNDVPPPAPPAPEVAPVPPVPPDLPMAHHHLHPHADMDRAMREMHMAMREMTPEERKQVHEILHNAHREMHEAMLKARPEMERAMAEIRAHRIEMEKLRPQIEQAMHDAKPEIERAMAEAHEALERAHVDERVRRHVEEAMQRVRMHMDRHRHWNDDGDAMQHVTHDHDMRDRDEEGSGDRDEDDHS